MMFFGPRPATRIGIPFVAHDDFTWELRRRRLVGQAIYRQRHRLGKSQGESWEEAFRKIQPALEPSEIALGYGDFDYEFSIETDNEEKMCELLANPELRGLLQGQRSLYLKVVRNDKWLASLVDGLPDRVAVLYFQTLGTLTDESVIGDIYQILGLMIAQMASVGSAAPPRPELFLSHL